MTRTLCSRLLPLVLACVGCGAGGMASMGMAPGISEEAHAPEAAAPEHGSPTAEPATAGADAAGAIGEGTPDTADGGGSGSASALTAIVVRRGGRGEGEERAELERARRPAPLLVYTAALSMEVDGADIAATIERIIEEAVQLGGYLASRDDRSVQVRVPSAQFREGLGTFEQMGDVTSRRVSAQDVTEEYSDLEVRLQNLRAIRDRLESFLQRASNIEEVMRVHAELERVAREIDGVEGRLRFLSARVAYSLVTVTLSARPVVQAPAEPREPAAPPPPPPPQRPDLPVDWMDDMGLDRLLNLREEA